MFHLFQVGEKNGSNGVSKVSFYGALLKSQLAAYSFRDIFKHIQVLAFKKEVPPGEYEAHCAQFLATKRAKNDGQTFSPNSKREFTKYCRKKFRRGCASRLNKHVTNILNVLNKEMEFTSESRKKSLWDAMNSQTQKAIEIARKDAKLSTLGTATWKILEPVKYQSNK